MPPENTTPPPTPSGVAREMASCLRNAAESSDQHSSDQNIRAALTRTAVEAAGLLDGLALMLDPQRPVTRVDPSDWRDQVERRSQK